MKMPGWQRICLVLIAAGLMIAIVYFKVPSLLQGMLKHALDWVASLGIWGPIAFVLIYILACVFFVPGSVLTLGAGALFGVLKGSVLVSISATLGATAAFLVGRYFARDWVARKLESSANFRAIDKAVAREGWIIVLLTRLSPLFPFTLLNYAFGLTQVSLRDYVLASWLGMMPGTVMYVYIGALAHAGAQKPTPAQWALRGLGLLATVLVTVLLTRIARKALSQRITS